jgi:hypothetical protein
LSPNLASMPSASISPSCTNWMRQARAIGSFALAALDLRAMREQHDWPPLDNEPIEGVPSID